MNVKDLEDERNMRELWLIFVHRSLLWAWISLEKRESKPKKIKNKIKNWVWAMKEKQIRNERGMIFWGNKEG